MSKYKIKSTLHRFKEILERLDVKLNDDGSFKAGGIADVDISNTAAIKASKFVIQKNYKKSDVANPSATENTDGTAVVLNPATNYVSLIPRAIDIVFGGTFGTETVTATVKVTYADTTTATLTKTATATGTTSLTNAELMSLVKDNTYINKIEVYSKTTIATTTATVTFNHCGLYL